MAKVFLSYVREDAEKARVLAAWLERAGHTVWWDRHIKGGAQYATEIEAALAAADKVVVLWSSLSIGSAWVRDEAAAGRDSGRLVPVTVDGTEPPLGFRQYQTIDLSRWKGRARGREIDELLDSVGDGPGVAAVAPVAAQSRQRDFRFRAPPRWVAATLGAIALMIVAGGWWWSSRAVAHTPVVAIDAADGSKQSREVARQLAIRLGDLRSASSDAFQLVSGGGKADLRLQVDADDGPAALRRDLSFLSGATGSILWSTSLQQSPQNSELLSQQLTLTSERVLSCALEALSVRRDRIDPPTLKLYLSGCSRLEDVYGLDRYEPALARTFEQVIAKAPHFEGAWAKLLAIEAEAARQADPPRVLVDKLRGHIDRAQRLGLDIGELYAAKAALLPTNDFLGIFAILDQGIQTDPDNSLLLRLRGEEEQSVGRWTDAIYDASQALRIDPLSPALQDSFLSALAYSGKIDAAYEQLRKSEAMWPAATNIQQARYRLDLRFGDPKAALAFFRNKGTGGFDLAQQSFINARIDPTPANIQRAINEERVQYGQEPRYIAGLMQVLGQFGRNDEAIDLMLHYTRPDAIGYNAGTLFRPALQGMWRDPRSMAAAAHVGFLHYWKKSGRWPDFCADPTLPYDCKKEAAKYRV